MWPDLGHVENVEWCCGDVVGVDHLYIDVPGRKIPSVDGVLKIFDMVIRVCSSNLSSLGIGKVVNTLVGKEVDSDVMV